MFGGGEEYFQEPPAIDRDTLHRYAVFCAKLRSLEKPRNKAITETAALARAVGDTLNCYELVVGALFRHIKSWTGNKQLACWYVVDKLCREGRDKYGYTAGKYILEIGRDYIPYEDEALGPKYESLVEHWENVFPRHVVDALWLSKKERLWAVDHPAEIVAQQEAEEEEWKREEANMQNEDGLDDFDQPCIDYLQGRCTWGENCRLFHPPGEEGSLPPECRMGDWKCFSCGVINRHFRRRCSNCVREKPQYKKTRAATAEDILLSKSDEAALQALRQQMGYNPYMESEALEHWKIRMEGTTVKEYLEERRAAYKVRILGHRPSTALEERCKNQKHFSDIDIGQDADYLRILSGAGDEPDLKRTRLDAVAVPTGAENTSAIALLSQMIMERGVRDSVSSQLFSDLARHVRYLSADDASFLTEVQGEALLSAAKLGFTAWNANRGSVPYMASFFKSIHLLEDKLGLTPPQREQLVDMVKTFHS